MKTNLVRKPILDQNKQKEEIYVNSNPDPNIWYIGFCASYHKTPHKESVRDYKEASIQQIKTGVTEIRVKAM